jgi:hypothetical protein
VIRWIGPIPGCLRTCDDPKHGWAGEAPAPEAYGRHEDERTCPRPVAMGWEEFDASLRDGSIISHYYGDWETPDGAMLRYAPAGWYVAAVTDPDPLVVAWGIAAYPGASPAELARQIEWARITRRRTTRADAASCVAILSYSPIWRRWWADRSATGGGSLRHRCRSEPGMTGARWGASTERSISLISIENCDVLQI